METASASLWEGYEALWMLTHKHTSTISELCLSEMSSCHVAPSYPPAEYNVRPSPLSYYLERNSQVTRECPLGYLLNPVTLILEVQAVA